jgi:hypothetical protein
MSHLIKSKNDENDINYIQSSDIVMPKIKKYIRVSSY